MRTPVIVFDVNETLSDLSPLAARFVAVGAPASGASLWFASVLRDGFALSVAGAHPEFLDVAREALTSQLSLVELDRPLEQAVAHVLAGMAELPVHADVVAGVNRLAEEGYRLVTLSNGGAAVAERLLEDAGVRDRFEQVLSVDEAPAWKPARSAYEYAARSCATSTRDMVLVATHPWDLDGAHRAGLRTAWVDRWSARYPQTFARPTYTVPGIDSLADALQGSLAGNPTPLPE